MCFFLFLGHSRNWPTLRPLLASRTLRSTEANFLPLIRSLFFPLPRLVAVSHGLLFTFIIPF